MTEDTPAAPEPDDPEPDDKDWTWVLDRTCPECGFDAGRVAGPDVADLLRRTADAWHEELGRDDVRERPAPTTWSPLEYGAHVRDVCRIYLERLDLMLHEDGPHYPNWDQDATAVEERYDLAEPATVAAELTVAARVLAARFDEVAADEWTRTGHRSDGATFTVDTFARYFVHDPIHHLWDCGRDVVPLVTNG